MQSEKFNGLIENRYKADFLQSFSHKAASKMVIEICKLRMSKIK